MSDPQQPPSGQNPADDEQRLLSQKESLRSGTPLSEEELLKQKEAIRPDGADGAGAELELDAQAEWVRRESTRRGRVTERLEQEGIPNAPPEPTILSGDHTGGHRPLPPWLPPGIAIAGVLAVIIAAIIFAPREPPIVTATPTPAITSTAGAVAGEPTATPAPTGTATPTAAPPTPTLSPEEKAEQVRLSFATGLEEYNAQNWAEAVTQLRQVYELEPDYLNGEAKQALTSAYYNWAVTTVYSATEALKDKPATAANDPLARLDEALVYLDDALAITPPPEGTEAAGVVAETQSLARAARQLLTAYLAGRDHAGKEEWADAIQQYQKAGFQFLDQPLADVAQRLYDAYMARGRELEEAGRNGDARAIYEEAATLEAQGVDISEATVQAAALVPPTPTPRPTPRATPRPTTPPTRIFNGVPVRSYPGSGNNGTFASCISGRVTYGGAAIAGASLEVNNGPANRFSATTNSNGDYRVCGLGASNWSVVLFFVPGNPPIGNNPAIVVYVNGNAAQEALVNFTGP